MKHIYRRTLAMALALVMLLALLPAAAVAAESDFVIDENGVLTKYNGPGGQVVIPSGVTSIGKSVFRQNGKVTGVTIPAGVTSIQQDAFEFCFRLSSVSIPSSVTSIGRSAFFGCPELASVTLPAGVTSIGESAFGSTALTSVVIPASVTDMGPYAFSSCSKLTSATIPDSVVLPGNAFLKTPFIETYRAEHENDEFCMLGHCLLAYNGSSPDVILPSDTRTVSAELKCPDPADVTIRSITFPDGMRTWARDRGYMPGFPTKKTLYMSTDNWFLQINNYPEYVSQEQEEADADYVRAAEAYQAWCSRWTNPFVPLEQSQAVTTIANNIVAEAGAVTDYEKAKAISYWVAANVKYGAIKAIQYYGGTEEDYAPENRGPMSNSADTILTVPGTTTACDGYSNVTYALLSAVGIPSKRIYGSALGHVWNEVFVDGDWILVDTTWMAPFNSVNGPMAQCEVEGEWFDATTPSDMIQAGSLKQIPTRYSYGRKDAGAVDTPSQWAKEEISAGFAAKLIPYDLAANYRANTTRQEFCRLMVRLVEQCRGQKAEVPTKNPFADTSDRDVLAAYHLGIVKGVTPTSFNPNGFITRQEAAVMLTRTAQVLGLSTRGGETFADENQIGSWAKAGVTFVSGLTAPDGSRVMGGTGKGRFSPLSPYTREQAYLTVLRLFRCAQ